MSQSTLDSKVLEFDATHSWNGYSYQGKVALIVVLELIIDCIKRKESLESFKIEFEWLEDFSIIKNDKYIQIHQVKSYGLESLSKYKEAIWLLLGKSVYKEYQSINNSYLHAAEVITSNKQEIHSTKSLLMAIETYKEPAKSKSELIAGALDYYNHIKSNGLKKVAFDKFKLYTYSDGKGYCRLLDIEEKVKEKILEYYICINKKVDMNDKGLLDRQIEFCYTSLLGLIDNHINERHITRQAKSRLGVKEIHFIEFVEILDAECDKFPKSYYIYYLKNKLINVINEYYVCEKKLIMEQSMVENQDPEVLKECRAHEEGLEKVISALKHIYSNLDDEEFLLFINRINPHIRINVEGNLFMDDLINPEFIKSPWIYALVSFHKELDQEKLLITIDKQYYLASTINHTLHVPFHSSEYQRKRSVALIEAAIGDIARKIIENRDIHRELYMIDKIITGNINASLKEYIHKVTDYRPSKDIKEGYHIMDIKNVELIDLENSFGRRVNK